MLTEGTEAESGKRQSADAGKSDITAVKCSEEFARQIDSEAGAEKQLDDDTDDEGVWGWLAVFGGWLIQLTGFGYSQAFGVYQDYYVRVYLTNCNSSQISWIGSTQLFLQLSIGIFAGRLFDKGYFFSIIITGCLLNVFSLFMLSLAQPGRYYQIFLAQAIGVGIGSGLANVPSLAVLARHFRKPHRRVLAMSVVASGSSTGGTLHPIMLNNLFNGTHAIGFGGAVRASAGMIAGCMVLACAVIRKEPPRGWLRQRRSSAEDGKTEKANGKPGNTTQMPLAEAVVKFAKDPPYVLMMTAMFFFSQGFFFPVFYLQLDAIVHHVDPTFAFYALTILNSASIVGRLAPGFLVRRVGLLNMLITASLACAAITTGMLGIGTNDVGGIAAIGALFGLFSGSYASLLAPTLAMLADDASEIGARIGVGFAFHGLGSLIGTPITGALLTSQDLWWRAIIYGGVMCLIAGVTYILSRAQYKKKKGIVGWII